MTKTLDYHIIIVTDPATPLNNAYQGGTFYYTEKNMSDESNRIKIPKTFEEQVDILISRELRVEDREKAIKVLSRINYYRLSAYMLTFKIDDKFEGGVTFNEIYDLYEFDKRLRNMIIGILETIEIAFRTEISYLIAHKYGAIGHMDAANFVNPKYHGDMVQEMDAQINRSNEIFIQHHIREYRGVFPVWVSIEVVSLNLLSKMYSNLKNEDKSKIAKANYGVPYVYIRNWLHALTMVRNTCAHYGRLYNKNLTIKFKLDKDTLNKGLINNTIFTAIYIMGKLTKDKIEWRTFVINLKGLIEQYEKVDTSLMGFPINWEELLEKI